MGCIEIGQYLSTQVVGYDHITYNAPDPIRTPKLTCVEPAQYWGGGPPGNSVVLYPLLCLEILVWGGGIRLFLGTAS